MALDNTIKGHTMTLVAPLVQINAVITAAVLMSACKMPAQALSRKRSHIG